jgi:hypothetical protein
MKINKYVWGVVLVLIVIIFVQRLFPPKPQIKVVSKVDTLYQRYDSMIYVPRDSIVFRDTGSTKLVTVIDSFPIPLSTDTLGMVLDYLRKRVSDDVILNDTNIYVEVIDTIQYNRIKSRKKIIHYYITRKIIPPKLHNKFYLGMGVGYDINHFGFSGKVLFQNKRDQIFGLSYDPVNHYWEISTYWKLRFKKRD